MTPINKNDSLESLRTNITSEESTDSKDNSVLQKLLNSKIGGAGPGSTKKKATDKDAPVSNMQKVVSMRYKIYTFLIVILGWFVWSSFLSLAINRNDFTKQTVENNELKVSHLQNKLSTYKRDQAFVALIDEQENSDAIYQCVNNEVDCEKLPEKVMNQLSLVKAYLQIGNLYDKKMIIDEKSLLINLDAFMTKEWKGSFPTDRSNGEILELLIGDPEQIDQQLYQVPLDVQIEFDDKDALLSFINNVENRIIKGIDASTVRSTPVFYKINQIEYDIVNYTEEQNVVVNMTAYYYQEQREELIVDEEAEDDEEKIDTTTATLKVEEPNEEDNTITGDTEEAEGETADESDTDSEEESTDEEKTADEENTEEEAGDEEIADEETDEGEIVDETDKPEEASDEDVVEDTTQE